MKWHIELKEGDVLFYVDNLGRVQSCKFLRTCNGRPLDNYLVVNTSITEAKICGGLYKENVFFTQKEAVLHEKQKLQWRINELEKTLFLET